MGDVKALIDLKVETKNIKSYIREKSGKTIQTKDISNIRLNLVREQEGGLTKGQLLAAALTEITEKKRATTYIQLDDELANVELVYIQTKEMKDHFSKYPEILFMDTTYNVNIEGYPLFAILAEDGDGRGKPVAYCYVRSETKENINTVLEKFCEYNDVKGVRIVMLDKDLNEMNAIREHIPTATVLLCKFHVMKYFKKKVSDLDIKHDEKKALGLLLQQIIDCKDQNHYDELYKELQQKDNEFVQYYNKNWHSCQSMWVIHFRKNLQTHGNNTNNKIESHNQKLKYYLTKHMHLPESVSNLTLFIEEAFTKSAYARYNNLKTKIDYRNTDKVLMQYLLLCNAKAFGIVNDEFGKYKNTKFEFNETQENYIIQYKSSCHTVSKCENKCDCLVFLNFGLPCRHIFLCREKQNYDIYDELLVPNRWRKEFETAGDGSEINVVQTSTEIKRKKKEKNKPKTTINKYNKAIAVCRDLATFISTCGEKEYTEKLTILSKLHSDWQSTRETTDPNELSVKTNGDPISTTAELSKFTKQDTNTILAFEKTADENETKELKGTSDDIDIFLSDCNVDANTPALEIKEDCNIFEAMTNVNIDNIKARRGRPKGSKKPFWNFSSTRRSNNGKKRKQESEKEVINKKVKLVDQENKVSNYQAEQDNFSNVENNDTSSTSSSKAETPWIETSLTKLNQNDRDEIIHNKDLSDRIVESAQTILRTQFPEINGFQSTLFKQNLKHFEKKDKDMVQILHRGDIESGHWFVISTVNCKEGYVNWYDSIYKDLDKESKQQICAIIKPACKQLIFQKCPSQNQAGGSDCGLFAIAFAVSICLGTNPSKFVYDQRKMRPHLIECLENQKFCNFPFSINTNWNKKKVIKIKENIYCICRGLYDSEMVQCGICKAWLHHRCLDTSTLLKIENDPHFCFECSTCVLVV